MRVPLSWLADHVDVSDLPPRTIAARLTEAGLQVERIESTGQDIGNVVVARVLALEELSGFKKPIRWVTLTDGSDERQVICGATNFAPDDVVAYARPPATLPGGFVIERRKAYGHDSDGMICSARELGLGEDHTGILVLGHGDAAGLPLGADVVDALHLRDDVLDISINPDRGYALSIRGVAREVATAFGLAYGDPGVTDPAATTGPPAREVRIDDRRGCDRYLLRSVTDLDPTAASPAWLQRRLTLAGMRPISLAVDVTNHVMLDLGQPLHAFDAARVSGPIVVRRAVGGEVLRTLDDVERRLDPADLLITDDSGPIAIAGVMGGLATEITDTTTDVLIESAHFDPVSVAYTARRHRLGSEASRRFERGVDAALQPAAAQAAVRLLVQLGRAADTGAVTDVDHRQPRPVIRISPELPGRLAGVDYPPEQVRRRLTDVGCEVAVPPGDTAAWDVTPPSWRPDLQRPVDLVEEVVRLEGYSGLPVTVPRAPAGSGLTRVQRQRRRAGRALAAAGFTEVVSVPFVAAEAADRLQLGPGDARRPSVRLANAVSDEEPWLRSTLLPGLLAALTRNVGRGFPDVALFEIGPVFRRRADQAAMPALTAGVRPSESELAQLEQALPDQPPHAGGVLAGRWERPGWWGPGRAAGWADAVEAARTVLGAVGGEVSVVAATDVAPWHPGRCAALSVAGEVVGHAGELHPRVVEALGLPARTAAFEVSLAGLLAIDPPVISVPALSTYPIAAFDVAVVVARDVPVAEVAAALRSGAGPLLESLRLFDVYGGDQIGGGEVSYAFAARLRAPDRTLTAEEVAEVRDAAVSAARERTGARLRA